jgi:hypothetical protein
VLFRSVYKDGIAKLSIDKNVRANLLVLAEEQPDEIPADVAEVIQCADDLWASSVAKFNRAASLADEEDDRVRGAFVFSGGSATGRASSFGLQVHNFPRKCADDPALVREAMVRGHSIVPKFGTRVTDVLKAKAGETLVISAAAGAVGSCVVQFAKARGARVIGIAGGPAKCGFVTGLLGADAAIDYKSGDVGAQLAKLAPEGIDLFFDNVGGEILDAALDNLRPTGGARVVICGAISQYQNLNDVRGPKLYLRLAERNASMRGFVVSHHAARFAEAIKEISQLIRVGKAHLPEHAVSPIDRFPEAMLMLFTGQHSGNLVVKP